MIRLKPIVSQCFHVWDEELLRAGRQHLVAEKNLEDEDVHSRTCFRSVTLDFVRRNDWPCP